MSDLMRDALARLVEAVERNIHAGHAAITQSFAHCSATTCRTAIAARAALEAVEPHQHEEICLVIKRENVDLRTRLAAVEADKDVLMDQGEAVARERDALRVKVAAVEAERDAWKNAIIDAAVVSWTYQKSHEDDPRAAVNALLAWTTQVALDPVVSEPASRLHARITMLEAQHAQCANLCRCGCHA